MSNIETTELTPKQAKTLKDLKRQYGEDNDWTPVVQYLDSDIQKDGRVVAGMQILNMLLCEGANDWYGEFLMASCPKPEGVTIDEIIDFKIEEAITRGWGSEEEIRGRVDMDAIVRSAEFMRRSGLMNKLPDGKYKLSDASIKYWDYFIKSYEMFNKSEKAPIPAALQGTH